MNHQKTSLIRKIFAKILTVIFFGLAVVIVFSLLFNVVEGLLSKENVTQVFLGSINTGIIALAVFELAFIINKEYSGSIENDDKDAISSLSERFAWLYHSKA
jgi:uncharacterized membrane protein (DUF485 family)